MLGEREGAVVAGLEVLSLVSRLKERWRGMEFTTMLGSIGLCVGAIVAAAAIYFVVTAIKGRRAERKEREALEQHQNQRNTRARR